MRLERIITEFLLDHSNRKICMEENRLNPYNYCMKKFSNYFVSISLAIIPVVLLSVKEAAAVNFKPGNYELTTWTEVQGRAGKEDRQVQCLSEKDVGPKVYKKPECAVSSEKTEGDKISWDFNCGYSGVSRVSGSITYSGDSFDGSLTYFAGNGREFNNRLTGKRLGDCPPKQDTENSPTAPKPF